jgi:hypothetical protein
VENAVAFWPPFPTRRLISFALPADAMATGASDGSGTHKKRWNELRLVTCRADWRGQARKVQETQIMRCCAEKQCNDAVSTGWGAAHTRRSSEGCPSPTQIPGRRQGRWATQRERGERTQVAAGNTSERTGKLGKHARRNTAATPRLGRTRDPSPHTEKTLPRRDLETRPVCFASSARNNNGKWKRIVASCVNGMVR